MTRGHLEGLLGIPQVLFDIKIFEWRICVYRFIKSKSGH